jgi:hypothetical protein
LKEEKRVKDHYISLTDSNSELVGILNILLEQRGKRSFPRDFREFKL